MPPARAWSATHWKQSGLQDCTRLAWLFQPVSPPGVRHINFIYFLGFGTVGIRKKKMIQELLLSLNQAKNKIKVHHHIKVRKSSAFISMQRAWALKASRDDASRKGFKGWCFVSQKSKAFWIIIRTLHILRMDMLPRVHCWVMQRRNGWWMDDVVPLPSMSTNLCTIHWKVVSCGWTLATYKEILLFISTSHNLLPTYANE